MSEKKLNGFVYDGTFELNFLQRAEAVRACPTEGKGACEILVYGNPDRSYRVRVGDTVARLADGSIVVIATASISK